MPQKIIKVVEKLSYSWQGFAEDILQVVLLPFYVSSDQ